MSKVLQDCLLIASSAKRDINEKLKGTEYVHTLLEFNSLFERIETRFKYMGAKTAEESDGQPKKELYGPITSFMGEKVVVSKKIDKSEYNADNETKKKFRADVNKLYEQLPGLAPDIVLNAYTLPEHILILRGVAKLAGVEDFESRNIDTDFIEDIQLAILDKKEKEDLLKNVDKATKPKPVVVILTQEMIDADEEMQKLKAQPGDEIVTNAITGKRSLKGSKNK